MGVTLLIAFLGAALVTTGLFLVFGPWALVACGAPILAAGLMVDWEKAS